MRALVTGGGGFLGSEIARQLLEKGVTVRSLQRSRSTQPGSQGAEIYGGDITDAEAVNQACRECDVVFHVAGRTGVWGRYRDYYRPNVIGTKNIINACLENGIEHLVYTSSPSAVFDGRDEDGIDESVPYPEHFLSHYCATKAEAERLVLTANGYRLSTVALRPHLIWGPGDPHLFPRVISRARIGKLKLIENHGRRVDTTYITNAAHAHLLAWGILQSSGACAGKAYFISNGEPKTMAELINRFLDLAGLPPVTRTVSPGLAYAAGIAMESAYKLLGIESEPFMTRFVAKQLAVAHWYDLSAAKNDLGYKPLVSIDEGMDRLQQALSGDYGRYLEQNTA